MVATQHDNVRTSSVCADMERLLKESKEGFKETKERFQLLEKLQSKGSTSATTITKVDVPATGKAFPDGNVPDNTSFRKLMSGVIESKRQEVLAVVQSKLNDCQETLDRDKMEVDDFGALKDKEVQKVVKWIETNVPSDSLSDECVNDLPMLNETCRINKNHIINGNPSCGNLQDLHEDLLVQNLYFRLLIMMKLLGIRDKYARLTYRRLIPGLNADVCFTKSPTSRSVIDIVTLLEVKKTVGQKSELVGQLLQRLEKLTSAQPGRKNFCVAGIFGTSLIFINQHTSSGITSHTYSEEFPLDWSTKPDTETNASGFHALLQFLLLGSEEFYQFKQLYVLEPCSLPPGTSKVEFYKRHGTTDIYSGMHQPGENVSDARTVVIKVVGESQVAYLDNEKKALELIKGASGVPEALGYCTTENGAALVMSPFGRPLPKAESLEDIKGYLKNIASAIVGCHQKGVLHGDICPSNMVICESKGYLIDFGCARHADASITLKISGKWPYFSRSQHLAAMKTKHSGIGQQNEDQVKVEKYTRVDDWESFFYSILDIACQGKLPWRHFSPKNALMFKVALFSGSEGWKPQLESMDKCFRPLLNIIRDGWMLQLESVDKRFHSLLNNIRAFIKNGNNEKDPLVDDLFDVTSQ